MKLRFNLEREQDGLLIVESEPQYRNLILPSSSSTHTLVPLPYIYFVVRYSKKDNTRRKPERSCSCSACVQDYEIELKRYEEYIKSQDKKKIRYFYPGVYGNGLRVYGSITPIVNFDSEVFLLPTDICNNGNVCTPHDNDGKKFKSPEELARFVISLWWNISHVIENQPFSSSWKNKKLEDLKNGQWKKAGSLFDAMHLGNRHCYKNNDDYDGAYNGDTFFPKDSILIDENFESTKNSEKAIEALEELMRSLKNEVTI